MSNNLNSDLQIDLKPSVVRISEFSMSVYIFYICIFAVTLDPINQNSERNRRFTEAFDSNAEYEP